MKNIQLLVLTTISLLLFGCSSKARLPKELPIPTKSTQTVQNASGDAFLIPESLYLENRVANCDSAIVFMKSVIVPGNADGNGFSLPGESRSFLRQEKIVDKGFIVPNNQRFYISIDCLVGQNIQVFLDIFVPPKFHENSLKKYRTEKEIVLFVKGIDFVSFYLFVKNGVIHKTKFNFGVRAH